MAPHQRSHSPRRTWLTGTVAGLVAIGAVIVGIQFQRRHGWVPHVEELAWLFALVVIVAGGYAIRRLTEGAERMIARRSYPGAGAVVRLVATGVGYIVIVLAVFGVLGVSLDHLLIGAGVAGVVIGIAAQQSLGNVFSSLVLLFARPFVVGDRIRIRSGALGGVFDVTVLGIGLTYVTVETDDGVLKVPNSAMLAAGIAQVRIPSPPSEPGGAEPSPGARESD